MACATLPASGISLGLRVIHYLSAKFVHMALPKINPFSKSNPDTGFGNQAGQMGGRFVNKDGSFNVKKTGVSFWRRSSIYSYLLELYWVKFLLLIIGCYLVVNILFTGFYHWLGPGQLQGLNASTYWSRLREEFYFSSQTFTTVGYGRINPVGDGADVLAALESMCGWLFFALVTGILYGRFTRPQAFIDFSENALISPYKTGRALMFRMVPFKTRHYLTDVKISVTLSMIVHEGEKPEYKYYQLGLERSRVDMFNMNWTVVHPIDGDSPFLGLAKDDLLQSDAEVYVQVTGFDAIFSNQVLQRSSYTGSEIFWGGKFRPMYHESEDGKTTIVEIHKLNHFDPVSLEERVDAGQDASAR